MLVSLHLPKTAGSSFLAALDEHFGKLVLRDYEDLPINTPPFQRKTNALTKCVAHILAPPRNVQCIHGHFLILKYRFCRNVKFITWMRDPIERLGSHYHYWIKNFNPETAGHLHKRVVEEKWSFERFCFSPEFKNFYSQFLWGFPIKKFHFIGITECFETEMDYFAENFLGSPLNVHRKNVNDDRPAVSYFHDKRIRNLVAEYHSKDVLLYQQALKIQTSRRSTGFNPVRKISDD